MALLARVLDSGQPRPSDLASMEPPSISYKNPQVVFKTKSKNSRCIPFFNSTSQISINGDPNRETRLSSYTLIRALRPTGVCSLGLKHVSHEISDQDSSGGGRSVYSFSGVFSDLRCVLSMEIHELPDMDSCSAKQDDAPLEILGHLDQVSDLQVTGRPAPVIVSDRSQCQITPLTARSRLHQKAPSISSPIWSDVQIRGSRKSPNSVNFSKPNSLIPVDILEKLSKGDDFVRHVDASLIFPATLDGSSNFPATGAPAPVIFPDDPKLQKLLIHCRNSMQHLTSPNSDLAAAKGILNSCNFKTNFLNSERPYCVKISPFTDDGTATVLRKLHTSLEHPLMLTPLVHPHF